MTSSTQRSREHRARKREGWALFTLALPVAPLGDTLVQAQWLDTWDRDDPQRMHAALERALLEWFGCE